MRELKKELTTKIQIKRINKKGEEVVYNYERKVPNPRYKSNEQRIAEAKEYYFSKYPDELNEDTFKYCEDHHVFVDIKGNAYSENIKKGKLKLNPTNHDYTNIGSPSTSIGIVMMKAFGKYIPGMDVDHIVSLRKGGTNELSNLQMLTHEENMAKMIKELGHAPNEGMCGKDHVRSKPVLQLNKDGSFVKEWESQNLAATTLGIEQCQICACVNMNEKRTSKFRTAKGYIWKNKD